MTPGNAEKCVGDVTTDGTEQGGSCRFCQIVAAGDELLYSHTDVAAFYDAFPSAPGHILVVPTRHVAYIRDLTPREWGALTDAAYGFLVDAGGDHTVGVNDGPLAGQTVAHLHLHLIPRREGNERAARGGIRWVLPDTADYWTEPPVNTEFRTGLVIDDHEFIEAYDDWRDEP